MIFQGQAIASQKPTIVAYLERRSWVDLGYKAIFFSDGYAYIFKPTRVNEAGRIRLHALKARIKVKPFIQLAKIFDTFGFIDIPEELVKPIPDGNDLLVYFASPNIYHKVHDYMVENESLNQITDYMRPLIDATAPGASEVPLETVVSELRIRLKNLPPDLPQHQCLHDFLHMFVDYLSMNLGEIDRRQYKDLLK